MYRLARLIESLTQVGKTIGLRTLVAEFEHTIYHELDMFREGGNASTLRRHFADSDIMYVPIYWQYTRPTVLVMERIFATPINKLSPDTHPDVNFKQLAANGVEIFFTQVLRDRFFHADMHPGNLFVDISTPSSPRYIGVDFGIMGALSPTDQRYIRPPGFFNAITFVWPNCTSSLDGCPSHPYRSTAAVRAVAEPIFERPISEISFAHLLLKPCAAKHFAWALPQRCYKNAVCPVLQKTHPELDLWETLSRALKSGYANTNTQKQSQ